MNQMNKNKDIQEMLDFLNAYCYENAFDSLSGDLDDDNEDNLFQPRKFPRVPCSFTVVNNDGFLDAIQSAINKVLHRYSIYTKPPQAKDTYVKMIDVTSFSNKFLATSFKSIDRIPFHPACAIIKQLRFDLDLIEVCNGFFLKISQRQFLANAIPESQSGHVKPEGGQPNNGS